MTRAPLPYMRPGQLENFEPVEDAATALKSDSLAERGATDSPLRTMTHLTIDGRLLNTAIEGAAAVGFKSLSVARVIVVGSASTPSKQLVGPIHDLELETGVERPEDMTEADISVCCTSACEPPFDSVQLRDETVVVAKGSFSPFGRYVDTGLERRTTIVFESRKTALTEADDIVLAVTDAASKGTAVSSDLAMLLARKLMSAAVTPHVFNNVGPNWSDVAVEHRTAVCRELRGEAVV